MKVSAFVQRRAVYILAAAYFAAHLPLVAPSLEDIDSINFALGLRDFDPARHQPHPPGSPVYIVLGRVMLALIGSASHPTSRSAAEALALGILSAIAGAVAIVAAADVFKGLLNRGPTGGDVPPSAQRLTVWATALLAGSPLFWLSGLRPMSDLPGLAVALLAQALILRGRTDRRALLYGALASGLAAGLRVQTVWLTVPLLGLALFEQRGAGAAWLVTRPIAAITAGGLAWAIPLVADSGGIDGYLRALGSQTGEDFAWVHMLWLDPTPRRLAFALYETFVLPWGSTALAILMAVLCSAGAILVLLRERSAALVLLLGFAPYAVFHLLFQETITVRYALPTLPAIAWLAARGMMVAGRFAPLVAAPVLGAALIVALPTGVAYGREPHPVFQAIADEVMHRISALVDEAYRASDTSDANQATDPERLT